MKKFIFRAIIAVSLANASAALALTISVFDNLPDNAFLPASRALAGRFDIRDTIPAEPYTIASAKYTFEFRDDTDLIPLFSNYETHLERSDDFTSFTRHQYDHYFDDYELINLKIGDQDTYNWTEYYTAKNYDADESYTYDGYQSNYTVINQDVIRGYGKHLEITQYLDPNAFENLNQDGIIAFILDMEYGDIFLQHGRLDLEYRLNSAVPEPATLWLVLCALGLAGLTRSVKKFFKFSF